MNNQAIEELSILVRNRKTPPIITTFILHSIPSYEILIIDDEWAFLSDEAMLQLIILLNQCPQLDMLVLNDNNIHSLHLPEASLNSLSYLSLQGISSNHSFSLELPNLTELCIDNGSLQSITHFQVSNLPLLQSITIHSYCLSSFHSEELVNGILSNSIIK